MKPANFLFRIFLSSLIIFLFTIVNTFASDTLSTVCDIYIKYDTLYVLSTRNTLAPPPAPAGTTIHINSSVTEYNIKTKQIIRYYETYHCNAQKIRVDSKGNKFLAGAKGPASLEYDYLESDLSRQHIETSGHLVISKYNNDYSINNFNTIIPLMQPVFTHIELNSNDELYFATSNVDFCTYYDELGGKVWPIIPIDTCFYTSPNAFQPLRNLYEERENHYGNDAYIAKLSENGKKLEYATFLGNRGSDDIFSFAIGKNSEILVQCFIGPGRYWNQGPLGVLYGMYPVTENALEPVFNESDSLGVGFNRQEYFTPRCLGIFDSSLSKLSYGTYITNCEISSFKYDNDNRLVIAGWNRNENYPIPKGSFIARYNEDMTGFSDIKQISAKDWLDTIEYYHWGPGEDGSEYYDGLNRDIHINIEDNGDISLVALTIDPNHPVTNDARHSTKADSIDYVIYKMDKDFNVKYCSYFGSDGIETFSPMSRPPVFTESSVIIYGFTTDENFPSSYYVSRNGIFVTEEPYGELSITDPTAPQSFSIYPNPAQDYINIDEELLGREICIYNSLGIMISQLRAETKLNISNYPSGAYTIVSGTKVQRFVKM